MFTDAVTAEFDRLTEECRMCYQCGQCTSSCPNGRDLGEGPRRLVRLVLAGEIEAVLASEDLWRCTECGACTAACRMDIDVARVLARLRALEREGGELRCPERSAAQVAARRLERRARIDNLAFGATMASRGHVPRDLVGAAEAGLKAATQILPGRRGAGRAAARRAAGSAGPDVLTLPFYAGCALPQDGALHARVHDVAAGFGVVLDEAGDAGCCGHPSRGAVPSHFQPDELVYTACPACDASLEEVGVATSPLWDALTERARRRGFALRPAAPAFVPYVGCLAERDAALASLGAAAKLSGSDLRLDFPTLHSACCGALGGMYRGATRGSERLLRYAAGQQAPIVTPCVLCRDNVRSAARQLKLDVPVHFWPEFFEAAALPPEAATDA
jgi:Fe-S oxidoreductase